MNLKQCMNCGHSGWTVYELKNGLCLNCQEENEDFYEDDEFEIIIKKIDKDYKQ